MLCKMFAKCYYFRIEIAWKVLFLLSTVQRLARDLATLQHSSMTFCMSQGWKFRYLWHATSRTVLWLKVHKYWFLKSFFETFWDRFLKFISSEPFNITLFFIAVLTAVERIFFDIASDCLSEFLRINEVFPPDSSECTTTSFWKKLWNWVLYNQLLKAVRTALEREFGYINGTREAALDSTDGIAKKKTLTSTGMFLLSDLLHEIWCFYENWKPDLKSWWLNQRSKKLKTLILEVSENFKDLFSRKILHFSGKSFRWDDLSSPRLNFIECFVKDENEDGGDKFCEIGAIQAWIAGLWFPFDLTTIWLSMCHTFGS